MKRVYGMSKIGINIFARVLARYETVKEKGIQVYSMCPGFVRTDMGGPTGVLSLQEGVETQKYLIHLPFEVSPEFQGKFFFKCEVNDM